MSYVVGVCLIVLVLVATVFGGKNVQEKGSIVLRVFSMPRLNAVFLKWVVGLMCMGFGLVFHFGGIKP